MSGAAMTSILLLSPHSDPEAFERAFMSPALGPLRLAGYLKSKGHDAEYYDPNIALATGKGPSLEAKLKEKPWDIVGFSILEETLIRDLRNMHLARALCPEALIVAGGIEAQFNYQNILDKSPCTVVVLGEGEVPMLMLAEGRPVHEIPGLVFKSNAQPLSAELFNEASAAIAWERVNYEDYWDYYVAKYGETMTPEREQQVHTVRVYSRNRCPIGCKYCSSTNQLTWGSGEKVPVISATADTVLSVVDRVIAAHPRTRTIYLTDDDFCINKLDVIRFCKKVVARGYRNLSFLCFARATDLTEEMLTWMKRAHFRQLNIGVESFSEKVLAEVNKRCKVADVHEGLALAKKVGIRVYMNIILVTPETTLEDIDITTREAIRYIDAGGYEVGVITAIRPLKGTPFYEEYTDYLSSVEFVPDTAYRIKVDEMIWASDPATRRVQARYHATIAGVVRRYMAAHDVRHTKFTPLARVQLSYMRALTAKERAGDGTPVDLDALLAEQPSFAWRAAATASG
jgi:radical SAM superfamily enzyme YgiQ (UPF0313 family)